MMYSPLMNKFSVESFNKDVKNPIVLEFHVGEEDATSIKSRTLFYPISVSLHTETASWIELRVLTSKWNQKPYLLMKILPALKEKLQAVNDAMMDHLKSHFPEAEIRPWISDQQDWIRFSIARKESHAELLYLEMEEPGIGTTLYFGGSGIHHRFHRKELCAHLVFEFHSVYKRENEVGFTPRLLKLIDSPNVTMMGFSSE